MISLSASFSRPQVPPQPTYLLPTIAIPLAGILPFGAVFIELFFILGVRSG